MCLPAPDGLVSLLQLIDAEMCVDTLTGNAS
jgi:hypothetical protein